MNVLEEMRAHRDELTDSERKVCDIVLRNPTDICSSSTMQIAARYHISQSSISRFCQKLGYGSFGDFRMALYLSNQTDQDGSAGDKKEQDLAHYMAEMVLAVQNALPDQVLEPLARRVAASRHVYLSGSAYSAIPARLLALQLTLASVPASYVLDGSEPAVLHGTSSSDTFILFSAGNPTHADLVNTMQEIAAQKRPYVILVTLTPKHPLRRKVDQVICLPSRAALHYPVNVDTTFTTNVFCNLFLHYLTGYLVKDSGAAAQEP